jgi:2-(1,2-epoxy-1,2-dihydrophenyl)acetyl-CoA isomerase
MSDALILSHTHHAVLTLTLNRPKALNSFTTAMHVELLAALNQAASDASVRCVVLTGAGRGFCAGQDLADPAAAPNLDGGPATDLGALIDRFTARWCSACAPCLCPWWPRSTAWPPGRVPMWRWVATW